MTDEGNQGVGCFHPTLPRRVQDMPCAMMPDEKNRAKNSLRRIFSQLLLRSSWYNQSCKQATEVQRRLP